MLHVSKYHAIILLENVSKQTNLGGGNVNQVVWEQLRKTHLIATDVFWRERVNDLLSLKVHWFHWLFFRLTWNNRNHYLFLSIFWKSTIETRFKTQFTLRRYHWCKVWNLNWFYKHLCYRCCQCIEQSVKSCSEESAPNLPHTFVDTGFVIIFASIVILSIKMQAFLRTGKVGGGFSAPSTSSGVGSSSEAKATAPWVEK